jgi:hypothetical protein
MGRVPSRASQSRTWADFVFWLYTLTERNVFVQLDDWISAQSVSPSLTRLRSNRIRTINIRRDNREDGMIEGSNNSRDGRQMPLFI